jgi:hypothetical protein
VVAVALAATLVGACSSSRSESPAGGQASTSGAPASAGASTTSFGDLPTPCGKGSAKGATAQGVTASSIKIGYGDDAGFAAVPGLNHEMTDAMRAMIKWCNAQGGINGRQIVGTYYDAKVTEVTNRIIDACQSQFFLVGQGFALDSAQEKSRQGCKLPSVPGYAVSPAFSNAPLMVEPLPGPADYWVTSGSAQLAKLYPEKIKHSSAVFANIAPTMDSTDKMLSTAGPLGYKFSCNQKYNYQGEPDFKPFVTRLKNCGTQLVYFSGSPGPIFSNFMSAAAQLDFKPVVLSETNFYDQALAKSNTKGVMDNLYFRMSFTPLEEAKDNKATQQYIDIVKGDGGDINQLGEQAASAFLLWATSAKACGDNLTRDCVMQKLTDTHKWTAGGMHASGDPGRNLPPTCGLLLELKGTSFLRVTPKAPNTYECDPKFAAKTSGPVLKRANLGPDRISRLS